MNVIERRICALLEVQNLLRQVGIEFYVQKLLDSRVDDMKSILNLCRINGLGTAEQASKG